jgi:hypothetical protein
VHVTCQHVRADVRVCLAGPGQAAVCGVGEAFLGNRASAVGVEPLCPAECSEEFVVCIRAEAVDGVGLSGGVGSGVFVWN